MENKGNINGKAVVSLVVSCISVLAVVYGIWLFYAE